MAWCNILCTCPNILQHLNYIVLIKAKKAGAEGARMIGSAVDTPDLLLGDPKFPGRLFLRRSLKQDGINIVNEVNEISTLEDAHDVTVMAHQEEGEEDSNNMEMNLSRPSDHETVDEEVSLGILMNQFDVLSELHS